MKAAELRSLIGKKVMFHNRYWDETFTGTPVLVEHGKLRTAEGGVFHIDELEFVEIVS